jgi:hypothetical protein
MSDSFNIGNHVDGVGAVGAEVHEKLVGQVPSAEAKILVQVDAETQTGTIRAPEDVGAPMTGGHPAGLVLALNEAVGEAFCQDALQEGGHLPLAESSGREDSNPIPAAAQLSVVGAAQPAASISSGVEQLAVQPDVAGGTPQLKGDGSQYEARDDGFYVTLQTKDGPSTLRLTNFVAEITVDDAKDDGTNVARFFEIKAHIYGRKVSPFIIPAADYSSMKWVKTKLGAGAVIFVVPGASQHLRVAIQTNSQRLTQRTTYGHSGWRKIGPEWVFLHAGGAIGSNGPLSGIQVQLTERLRHLELPEPPTGAALTAAVNASLRILKLGPDEITFPLLAAVFAALMGGVDYSLAVFGKTGTFKSSTAALSQQHFGAGMDAHRFPASWNDTENAIEANMCAAQHSLFVVDDFVTGGAIGDAARQQSKADRVFRGVGNATARQRLKATGSLQATRRPECMVVSTGEEVPRGHSLLSRMLLIEVAAEAISSEPLAACQKDASDGLYSQCTAAFIKHIAGDYERHMASFRSRVEERRRLIVSPNFVHRRTPGMVAHLQESLSSFFTFAETVGAISPEQHQGLRERAEKALFALGEKQGEYILSQDPAEIFVELLQSVFVARKAHLANTDGGCPSSPELWGWRYDKDRYHAQGDRIGWVRGGDVFLEPNLSYNAARAVDRAKRLTVTPADLRRRLKAKGYLVSTEGYRGVLTVRVTAEKIRQPRAIRLSASLFYPPYEETGQSDQPSGAGSETSSETRDGGSGPAEDQPTSGPANPSEGPTNGPVAVASVAVAPVASAGK